MRPNDFTRHRRQPVLSTGWVIIAFSLLMRTPVLGMGYETGTLRGFVLGQCSGCAYDNWVSHVSEGIAAPGYNDYGPSFLDPQKNGFGSFTLIPEGPEGDTTLAHWRTVFTAALNEDWSAVDLRLASHPTWRYELVELYDGDRDRSYYLLRERLDSSFVDLNVDTAATDDVIGSFQKGWGLFVFNPDARYSKLIIEMPHPEDDFLAIPVGLEMFLRLDARVLLIAGAGREVAWDTTQGNYSNGNSLSDPSRNPRHPFAVGHETIFDLLDGGVTSQLVTIQMHSYDTGAHGGLSDVHMSAFADDNRPNPPLRDRAEHVDLVHFMGQWPVQGLTGYPSITRRIDQYVSLWSSPAYYFYYGSDSLPILSSADLIGYGWNRQAVYSHRVHNVDVDPENFIHIEIDEYPDGLWSPARWRDWLPGTMPATMATYALALDYYDAFVSAADSAYRRSHVVPDVTPPATVQLNRVIHIAADSVSLRWSPWAVDSFFDTYRIAYDTVEISETSPQITRTQPGFSALVDYRTSLITVRGLTQPISRYRFAVGSRDIWGNEAVRSNVLSLTGGTVAYRVSDPFVGCGALCRDDTLYLTFSEAGYLTGQVFVVLPPELEIPWPTGNQAQSVMPSSNVATNLQFATGRRLGSPTSDTIEVNVQWRPPYSDGNANRYIASLLIRNQLATTTDTLTITGLDSSIFYDLNGPWSNAFVVGPTPLYVDCAAPTASIAYRTPPSCAFGSSAALRSTMSISILRGANPPNSPLAQGYVEVNGNPAQRVTLFSTPLAGNYSNSAFPNAVDAATLWGYLNEGCNSLIVFGTDRECNTGGSAPLNVTKDTQPPSLTVVYRPRCYSPSSHLLLDDSLDVTTYLGTGCVALTGTLKIWYATDPDTFRRALDVAGFPAADSQATALWNWIVNQSGVPPTANGEDYAFSVRASDCAGNSETSNFVLCIDLSAPANAVSYFDARPSDMGVWLNWEWAYNSTQAVSMEVWRSNFTGDYAGYFVNRWSNLADPAHYPTSYPPPGFVKIVDQVGTQGTTATGYIVPNGQGHVIHGGPGNGYWMDEDSSWRDEHEQRDIYRYVTFVRDAGENPSLVAGYTHHVNGDRSTNYWLGDYTRDATPDPNGSSGNVNTADLTLLSTVYFTSVPPTAGYYDIGPETGENDVGRGMPMPDGFVDFSDLVPFSVNFGAVGPDGFMGMPPASHRLIRQTDPPVVQIFYSETDPIEAGDEFSVELRFGRRPAASLKIIETQVVFDPEVIEFVSATIVDVPVENGVPFASAKKIENGSPAVGIVVAAIGETARLDPDSSLACLTFRWINDDATETRLRLSSTRYADPFGNTGALDDEEWVLTARNLIPSRFALRQNYPNPFNPSTVIRFDLPRASGVSLIIYNVLGQEVRTLVAAALPAGFHRVDWDGRDARGQMVGSGIYVYRLQARNFVATRKMLLTR